jgi:hypothetical protein
MCGHVCARGLVHSRRSYHFGVSVSQWCHQHVCGTVWHINGNTIRFWVFGSLFAIDGSSTNVILYWRHGGMDMVKHQRNHECHHLLQLWAFATNSQQTLVCALGAFASEKTGSRIV